MLGRWRERVRSRACGKHRPRHSSNLPGVHANIFQSVRHLAQSCNLNETRYSPIDRDRFEYPILINKNYASSYPRRKHRINFWILAHTAKHSFRIIAWYRTDRQAADKVPPILNDRSGKKNHLALVECNQLLFCSRSNGYEFKQSMAPRCDCSAPTDLWLLPSSGNGSIIAVIIGTLPG